MKNGWQIASAVVALLVSTAAIAASSSEFASEHDAEAMVAKGVKFIKENGKEKGYAEITNKKGIFIDRDLYLVVYRLDGVVLAHGQKDNLVGKNLIDVKDSDGKEFVRERVELAKTKARFWQAYKFTDPVTKKDLPKSMVCERLDDTVVCGGIYTHK